MQQILQNLKTGKTELTEVPGPMSQNGKMLIQTSSSLISAGTERMLVEFSQASLMGKARSQPDKVKMVLDKIKSDGLLPTLESVFKRLDEPLPLGYCNAGVVIEVGNQEPEARDQRSQVRKQKSEGGKGTGLHAPCALPYAFKPGDRVVSNGPHAEMVSVPYNLCAKIPDEVTDEQAAFTVLGSIALQGIRLVKPELGEKIVVYGLGLIGLITVQLLQANGCEVMGIDINKQRLDLAEKYGARTVNPQKGNDPITAAEGWTQGKGVDGVLITASAKTGEIVHTSAEMCRKRGRIVLVGVVGLNLQRADFYTKELSFQVSCSYGPGRYDEVYEQKGQDYPYGFVRWTEKRNFEAVLEMMRSGKLIVDDLISHRFDFAQAPKAYTLLSQKQDVLGIMLQYRNQKEDSKLIKIRSAEVKANIKGVVIGVIGAGNFSKMTLIPALHKTEARIKYIADLKGEAALHLAKRYKAENAVSDYKLILQDPDINTVMIATRHNLHAALICESLKAGKHVFVEKPLAMNTEELQHIIDTAHKHTENMLMVGFNRRFSPHIWKIKQMLNNRTEPLALTMTINAGSIPSHHWVHDPELGGGRIIGEACHFLDLMVDITGSSIQIVSALMMNQGVEVQEDKMSISLGFKDGSVGTVNYFANGFRAYPKEVLEVFSEGRIFKLDNFRQTIGYGCKGFKKYKTKRQDKGHAAECAVFVNRIQEGGDSLIPLPELVNVTLTSFAAVTSAREERVIRVDKEYSSFF